MLTLFTCVMPFSGQTGIIQRNAIKSWTLLEPSCEILLFGDGPGIEEAASSLGVRHIKGVACNEYGTPLVNDIFNKAETLASNGLLCYINSHIILVDDFIKALRQAHSWSANFIMISRRWDADIGQPMEFPPGWEDDLLSRRQRHDLYAIEYFVFPKGIWPEIPPFAVGRPWYDWWFLRKARDMYVPVVDASTVVLIIHQQHGYSHVRESRDPVYGYKHAVRNTPEAKENLRLSGFTERTRVTLNDADYELGRNGVRLKFAERIRRACTGLLYQ